MIIGIAGGGVAFLGLTFGAVFFVVMNRKKHAAAANAPMEEFNGETPPVYQ